MIRLSLLELDSTIILPALATLSVVVLIVGKLYYKIRTKFSITVNCWFCNSFTSVPYNCSNSWYCPTCDQYNGFCSDGSYNRILPEQFNEKLNCGSWCVKSKQKSTRSNTNGLCRFCNINLELKIQQLALFSPLNKSNFDEEVHQYSEQLERVYRLCSRCQGVLDKTLNKKQEVYITNQHQTFKPVDYLNSQKNEKDRHFVYLGLTALLSLGLLLSVLPYDWTDQVLANYSLPDYVVQVFSLAQQYFPRSTQLSVILLLGIVVQIFDCIHMRDTTSLLNLLLWLILLLLSHIPVKVNGLVSIVQMLASIVFFITSITESKRERPKNIAAVKPVQFHKLDEKSHSVEGSTKWAKVEPTNKPISSKSPVSDLSPTRPTPAPSHEPITGDFGFSKLNVSSKRITRSQTKPFQTKQYGFQVQNELFRPKPVSLTPPKLQCDKTFDYQVPLTRSSSQSSGFVSLSHQKDFEDRSQSIIVDNIDSISQCGTLSPVMPYSSSPSLYPQQYGMPFSNFQPYAIVHFTPSHLNKFYQYPNLLPHELSSSMSVCSVNLHRNFEEGWFSYFNKIILSPLLLSFLVISNVAILWKVFGEDYFKI